MNYLTCRALLALENTQPSLFSTPKRIEGLRSIYGVDCDCSHCEDWALFEKFACPACKASSRSGLKRNSLPRNPDPAPWKCQTCQMVSDTALDGPSAPLRDEPSFNSGLDRTYDKYKEPLLYMRCLLTETQQILPDHGVVFEGLVLMLMQTAGKWVARVGSGMIVLGRRTIKDVDPAAYIALLTYGEVHFDQNEQNAVGAVRETNRKVQRLVQ
ncbi:hypothetical protein HK097_011113 [Rhizophlyctis rosea]|uniref:Uncharacterized protein n=1 Tax=Rhizophlyctis rosea TaxID=64517 RepID=A0AAD5SHR3_9FUNG|nr:hypothetical protein HK097_011113 [Rhizophlyctis rosea]